MSLPIVRIIGLESGYRGGPLENELKNCGFSYEFIPGVIFDRNASQDYSLINQNAARVLLKRPLTNGEIGCSLAHRNACQSILDSPQEWAIVMEDDARLKPEFRPVVEAILNSYGDRSDPHVFLLETRWAYCLVTKSKSKKISGFENADVFSPRAATIGAAAYLINRRAAALYVEAARPVEFVADWHPAFWASVDVSVVHPQPVRLAVVESTLEAGRAETDPLKLRLGRLMSTYTGIRYLRHRAIYRNPETYFRHEIARPWWYFLGRRFGRRISADPDAPLSLALRPKRTSR